MQVVNQGIVGDSSASAILISLARMECKSPAVGLIPREQRGVRVESLLHQLDVKAEDGAGEWVERLREHRCRLCGSCRIDYGRVEGVNGKELGRRHRSRLVCDPGGHAVLVESAVRDRIQRVNPRADPALCQQDCGA
jgi:hypothetical protein